MEALVLGRPGIERTRVERLLTDAQFSINACHDNSWGCVGMDAECPLDALSVDVAIAVAEAGDRFDAQGIACVHRARIPIVTIGATANDPVLQYATESVARADPSLLDVVRVAALDTTGHRGAIEAALATHLADTEQVAVTVSRTSREVRVVLHTDVNTDRAGALADFARAAVRTYDPRVPVIDVSVVDPAAT